MRVKPRGRTHVLLVVLSFAAIATAVQSSPAATTKKIVQGTPYVGGMGVKATVAEIMARPIPRSPLPDLPDNEKQPDRSHLLPRPGAVDAPSWPLNAKTSIPAPGAPSGATSPQTVGTQFTGSRFAEENSWPPDTDGAVGPTQFVVGVNGRIKSFNKATGNADNILNSSTDVFFASVLPATGTGIITSTTDPRVRFDPITRRWIVQIISFSPFTLYAQPANSVLIGVSSGPTITAQSSFTFFSFRHNQVGAGDVDTSGDNNCLLDYDTLGVDANALVIGGNMFCPTYLQSNVYVVRKSSVMGAGPMVVTPFRGLDKLIGGTGPYAPQGVDNPDPTATISYAIGVDSVSNALLKQVQITNPAGTPSVSMQAVTVNAWGTPAAVANKGSTVTVDHVDDRLFMAAMRNGRIWTSHNVGTNASGTSTPVNRDGSRYYEVDPGTATRLQEGTLYDATANGASYWFPAANVNGQGHMAMGTSIAGPNDFIGAAMAGKFVDAPSGTIGAPALIIAGGGAYSAGDNATPHRWGDYSFTSIDPQDDMTIWTIQEFAEGGADKYATRVAQLKAPAPATPSSASATVPSNTASVNVTIRGTATNGTGFFDPGAQYPNRLTASVSGGVVVNSATYVNPTTVDLNVSTTGATAGSKSVTITNPDGQSATGTGIFTVSGTGGPAVSVAPNPVAFGNVNTGGSATLPVIVTSVGSSAVTMGASSSSGAGYSVVDGCNGLSLAPGASCTVSVTFTPASNGLVNGLLSIADSAPSSPEMISLTGTGITVDATAPSKVLGLTGAPGDGSAALTWTPATDNVGVVNYRVYRDGVEIARPVANAYTATGLVNGASYSFRVLAEDAAHNLGALSDAITVVPVEAKGWTTSGGDAAHTGRTSTRGSITTPSILQTVSLATSSTASPLIVDLNNDGLLDVVTVTNVAAPGDSILVTAFKQTATGLQPLWAAPYKVPTAVIGGSPNDGFGTIAASDLNGDGIPEIAVNTNYRLNLQAATSNDGRLTLLSGATGGKLADIVLAIGLNSAPVIGDINGDGIKDVVLLRQVGGTTGAGYYLSAYDLSGSSLTAVIDTLVSTTIMIASPALADLDPARPGLEIVAAQDSATSAVYLCKPAGTAAGCTTAGTLNTGVRGLSVADLNADGRPDIVANGEQSSTTGTKSLAIISGAGGLSSVDDGYLFNASALGDVNGDGNADVVNVNYATYVNNTTRAGNVHAHGFNGAITNYGTLNRPPVGAGTTESPGAGALVDIAGTSKPEYVFGSLDGTLNAVSFSAAGAPASFWSLAAGGNIAAPLAIGDVTGDGLADIVALTDTAKLIVVGAGKIDHITLSPAATTVTAGTSQPYTVRGFDALNNDLGDVTASSLLSIAPDGTCTTSSCRATQVGPHTVTASNSGKTATATMNVTASPVASIAISPATASTTAGTPITYTATGTDQFGNSLGDVTATTTFAIDGAGTCTANACGSTVAGPYTVSATNGTATANASLTVTVGSLATLALAPANATIDISTTQAYTATGRDQYGNSLGDLTAGTTFTIVPNGSCTGAVCKGTAVGSHTVTGRNGTIAGTASLTIVSQVVKTIAISPASATITAGGSQAYTAEGFDQNGVSAGDVTSTTVFTIAPNGSCTGATCSATAAGPHTVTAARTGATATASLTVVAGPATRLAVSPGSASITKGGSQVYTALGLDSFGNVTGDLTSQATFVITPDGSCTAATCGSSTVGAHRVTATANGLSGSASLSVLPAAPVITSPAAHSLQPGTVVVTGTAEPAQQIQVFDGTLLSAQGIIVDAEGNWSTTMSFSSGAHSISARAIEQGIVGPHSASVPFTVDATGPTLSIFNPWLTTPFFSPYLPSNRTVAGSATDDTGVVKVELIYKNMITGQVVTATATCLGCPGTAIRWSNKMPVGPGFWTVSAIASDGLGNVSITKSQDFFTAGF